MIKNIKKIIWFLCSLAFFTVVAVGMPQIAMAEEGVAIDTTNFPDKNFRDYVTSEFDMDNNGKLSEQEITRVIVISVREKGIESLKGVEYFTALTELNCDQNQLTELDIRNTVLTYLYCDLNQLTKLDISSNTNLTSLFCAANQLTELNISNNTALTSLNCAANQLTKLDASNNIALTSLNCYANQLLELRLNSQTYDTLPLYKGYLHGSGSNLSDLQNIIETSTDDYYNGEVSLIKIVDVNKPATYKVNGSLFTIIYADKVTLSSPTPPTEPSASPVPSTKPSAAPSASPVVPSDVHIFSDYNYTSPMIDNTPVIYGNGKVQTINGKKVNNKLCIVYTDILASYKYTSNSNGTVKASVGKVVVAVTKAATKPDVNNKNKITDTSASKIAKAKIKNGQITVTAVGKESGTVYLWVIDTGNKGASACCPIDVKLAPKKLEVQSTTGTKLTKTKLANGNTLEVCVAGLVGSAKTDDCTYTATVDSKYQSCITVTPIDGSTNKFTIKAIGLKNNKDTKATVTFKCDQNGKKTNFSLTITK